MRTERAEHGSSRPTEGDARIACRDPLDAADFGFEELDVSRPKSRARRIDPEIPSHLI